MTGLQGDQILKRVPELHGFKVLPPAVVYHKIGQGGMGAVYRGRHLNLEIEVAVKCMRPGLGGESDNFLLRFQREAKIAASIRHENLIQVYDVASVGDVHYLVMDFVDGESARQRVKRKGPLSEHEAATILLGAARGLAVAHKQRIVHRDVKPDNILIGRDGSVKLADLGIARFIDSEEFQTLTSGGIGTPQYMPPEQWVNAARVTPAADVWALGATLFYLLAGRNAITGITQGECTLQICNHDFPDIATVLPGITPALRDLLRRMTDRAPERRPSDGEAVVQELQRLLRTANVNLADPAAGAVRAGSELVSPPPADTLAKIRIEFATKGTSGQSGTGSEDPGVTRNSQTSGAPEQRGPGVTGSAGATSRALSRWKWVAAGTAMAGLAAAAFLTLGRAEPKPPGDGPRTAAVAAIFRPANEAGKICTREPRLPLSVRATDAAGEVVRLLQDGQEVWNTTIGSESFEAEFEVSSVPNSVSQLKLLVGAHPAVEYQLIHDDKPPVLVWRGPLSVQQRTASDNVELEFQITDSYEVRSAELLDDRETKRSLNGSGDLRRAQVALREGQNRFQLRASDVCGNEETLEVEVRADTTAPKLLGETGLPRSISRSNPVFDLEFSEALESVSNEQSCSVELRNGQAERTSVRVTVLDLPADTSPFSRGFSVTDELGNTAPVTLNVKVIEPLRRMEVEHAEVVTKDATVPLRGTADPSLDAIHVFVNGRWHSTLPLASGRLDAELQVPTQDQWLELKFGRSQQAPDDDSPRMLVLHDTLRPRLQLSAVGHQTAVSGTVPIELQRAQFTLDMVKDGNPCNADVCVVWSDADKLDPSRTSLTSGEAKIQRRPGSESWEVTLAGGGALELSLSCFDRAGNEASKTFGVKLRPEATAIEPKQPRGCTKLAAQDALTPRGWLQKVQHTASGLTLVAVEDQEGTFYVAEELYRGGARMSGDEWMTWCESQGLALPDHNLWRRAQASRRCPYEGVWLAPQASSADTLLVGLAQGQSAELSRRSRKPECWAVLVP